MKKTAVIVGASGLVGKSLLEILLSSDYYDHVKILVRNKLEITHNKLEQIKVNFDQLELYKEHLYAEDVFCCLGTTIKKAKTKEAFKLVDFEYPVKLALLSEECGVRNFLIITAMGSDVNSRFFYNQVKGEVEQEIHNIKIPAIHIFRPSLLLGNRDEFRLGEKFASSLTPLLNIFLTGGRKKYRPIQAKDVASAMYHAANIDHCGLFIYESDEIFTMSQ
ncbi:uncharacterized protein YbjT (DUF2867 family) [Bacillus mesophilus]|uniref:Oxidoreductase n=1 Tax=Bacillus mesophilus TaxID=1808955 RepID=A0A6M0Q6X8_9BACI|nr:oxidoreductase [Bacillus mesophilus]MBM7661360.1 uncharacterized protein YbjT (DUF2867 family) [Bacillus mesophilus]NEY72033.1 oxidoreductase [Bacillus mesophilus]